MEPTPLKITCTQYDIDGDWYEGDSRDKIILALHGYSSSKSRITDMVAAMCKGAGMSALAIEYSGHGDSVITLKDTRPAQHFLEVICAFDWLKAKYPQATIYVYGSSYGGFLAVQLTKYRTFDKLILKVPAIYKPEAFYDTWENRLQNPQAYDEESLRYRNDADALAKHPLLARASRFTGKTFVIVHEKDEFVPKTTTDAFIAALNADSFVAKGFTHRVSESRPNETSVSQEEIAAYQQKIVDWLKG